MSCGNENKLVFNIKVYQELSHFQIVELINRVKTAIPRQKIETEVTSKNGSEKSLSLLLASASLLNAGGSGRWVYPTEESIKKYQGDYNLWIDSLKESFEKIHAVLQQDQAENQLCVNLKNVGCMPASDVILNIYAFNQCLLSADEYMEPFDIPLPLPPIPPKKEWRSSSLMPESVIAGAIRGMSFRESLERVQLPFFPKRTTDFYLRSKQETGPHLSYGCDEFRHQLGEKMVTFMFIVPLVPAGVEDVQTVIKCELYARNIANVVRYIIPVVINYTSASAYDYASRRVDALIREQCVD